ncbi:MAG TPA: hypothetical protein OIM47_06250 [Faecalibacterium prausnitzii]|nr:hypothetical protein [Faecalibacterium prausnitzii]
MTDYTISCKLSNETVYAYYRGRFWHWNGSIWKESRIMTHRFELARAADKKLTPQEFLSNGAEFAPLDEYEIDCAMLDALENAKPCRNAPIEPVEEEPECAPAQNADAAVTTAENAVPTATAATPTTSESGADASALTPATSLQNCESVPAASAGGSSAPIPSAPSFDFGADEQTNALLLQDAQTFITGNMARIMAAKHAHDLTANHYKGSWGKWCAAVGISRDTGENMVRVAEQFGNIQLEGKSILDVQPLKLLYAAAKPSTPTQVKQAVFSGDITSYKEYQELLAQVREKDAHLEAAYADINGLAEQNIRLKDRATAAEAREEQAWEMQSKAEERAKNAEEALKHQPITAVIDEEEIDRRAAEKAWGLADARNAELAKDNANLKKQVAALRSRINDDAQADFEQANYCASLMRAAWDNSKASYSRLVGEDLESTFQAICGTLNSIMEEASLLCRQPPDYDGGDRDE